MPSDSCSGTEPLRMMCPVSKLCPIQHCKNTAAAGGSIREGARTWAGAQTPHSWAVVPEYAHPWRVWSSSSPLGSRRSLAGTEDTLQAFPHGWPRLPPLQSTMQQQRFPSNIPSFSRALKFQLEHTGKELPGEFSPWGAERFLGFFSKMSVIASQLCWQHQRAPREVQHEVKKQLEAQQTQQKPKHWAQKSSFSCFPTQQRRQGAESSQKASVPAPGEPLFQLPAEHHISQR